MDFRYGKPGRKSVNRLKSFLHAEISVKLLCSLSKVPSYISDNENETSSPGTSDLTVDSAERVREGGMEGWRDGGRSERAAKQGKICEQSRKKQNLTFVPGPGQ